MSIIIYRSPSNVRDFHALLWNDSNFKLRRNAKDNLYEKYVQTRFHALNILPNGRTIIKFAKNATSFISIE